MAEHKSALSSRVLSPAASRAADHIAKALIAARKQNGLSQADLGEFVDADRFAVAALENGRLTQQVVRLFDLLDAAGLELELRPRSARLASA